jgi:hypothetical protein
VRWREGKDRIMSENEQKKAPHNPWAFPCPATDTNYFEPGMSLRDWLTGQSLAGFCANPHVWEEKRIQEWAGLSYELADYALAEREKAS